MQKTVKIGHQYLLRQSDACHQMSSRLGAKAQITDQHTRSLTTRKEFSSKLAKGLCHNRGKNRQTK